MKKIMFNDKYGLTQAVLEGRKTMTRRMVCTKDVRLPVHLSYDIKTRQLLLYDACLSLVERSRYAFDEVVAIAQSYNDVIEEWKKGYGQGFCFSPKDRAGMTNKMFVRSEDMPHHIKITNIRVEHLREISDEDCMKEGIYKHDPVHIVGYNHNFIAYSYDATEDPHLKKWWFRTPREAFQKLIDKVSGKGTWDSNPFVWVYEFELVD